MIKKLPTYQHMLLALAAGALLPLAFAPIGLHLLAILAPALLLFTLYDATPKAAFWRGWLFGLGLFGIGVSWVYVSIHVYGETPVALALLITALFIAALALYPALLSYLFTRLYPSHRAVMMVLIFPALWVMFEWLRSWLFSGFPWLLLGYSQTNSFLGSYLPIVGVYGVSFIAVLCGGLLIVGLRQLLVQRKLPYLPFIGLLLIYLVGFSLSSIQWTRAVDRPLTVSLIQGNIPQTLKWSPTYIDETITTYMTLSRPLWEGSDIIVWPESAIPVPMDMMQPFLEQLSALASASNTTFITGIPVAVPDCDRYYNALITLGNGGGDYYKRHLVPFGEFVPLEKQLRGIINFLDLPTFHFVPGPGYQPGIRTDGTRIATFICYEIAFSHQLNQALPEARLLVTASNDAWFGDSFAPGQHLQIGQARSRQAGRDQLFVTNDGITAIIAANGQIMASLPQFTSSALTGIVMPRTGSTPWVRLGGEWPLLSLFFLIVLVGWGYTRWQ